MTRSSARSSHVLPSASAFALALALLAVVGGAAGCTSARPMPTAGNGELHQGLFVYTCASDADAFCAGIAGRAATSLARSATLPGIAVGGAIALAFQPSGGVPAGALDAEPGFFAAMPDGRLRARRAGYGAVLARTDGGLVIDFVNLRVRPVASLAIEGAGGGGEGPDGDELRAGDTRSVTAAPLDADGALLAGALELEWETSDPAVLAVEISEDDRARGGATIRALAPGLARVRAVSGGSTGAALVRIRAEDE
jgi:hypothetical protein